MIIVNQRGAVVAIRSQAVSKGALGPKLTEGVSGSDSGHDPTDAIFPIRGRRSDQSAWRQRERTSDAHSTGMIISRVHCAPEMEERALERLRGGRV